MTRIFASMTALTALGISSLAGEPVQHTIDGDWRPAVCFSAYRDAHDPRTKTYPTVDQIAEDLRQVAPVWTLIRTYDCSPHADRTLEAIRQTGLPIKVLLGGWLDAEFANPANSWMDWSKVDFEANRAGNEAEMERLISLANQYPDIVVAVAVGNEALVDWTDHPVTPERVLELVKRVKARVPQPVTVCDNWVPWRDGLVELAAEVDFISLHTYPQWEGKHIAQALDYSKANYYAVRAAHPGKPVIITEGGWCTETNSPQMHAPDATEANQVRYVREMQDWTRSEGITFFLFEAFDEKWKGSDNVAEPEKHWGVFNRDRTPKPAGQMLLDAAKAAE